MRDVAGATVAALAAALTGKSSGVSLRQGVIISAAADGTATVTISGGTTQFAGVKVASHITPTPGTTCWLAVDGKDAFVIATLALPFRAAMIDRGTVAFASPGLISSTTNLGAAASLASLPFATIVKFWHPLTFLNDGAASVRRCYPSFSTTAGTLTEDVASGPTAAVNEYSFVTQQGDLALPANTAANLQARAVPNNNNVRPQAGSWRWERWIV
ncbi:MAG: hypothetical protein KGL39_23060 [Patescibacteria group bacterium]|nr:hypothetical protein [Patescibacteria group bacterium]